MISWLWLIPIGIIFYTVGFCWGYYLRVKEDEYKVKKILKMYRGIKWTSENH